MSIEDIAQTKNGPQTFAELHRIIQQVKATCGVAPATPTGPTPSGSMSGNDSLELPPTVNPKRIYILGPMRGFDKYNFPAFYGMAENLRNAGYEAVNPAELDREDGFEIESLKPGHDFTTYPAGMDAEQVVRRDLKAIMSCAGYVALPGYEKSKGATAEKAVFDWRGAKRLEYFSVHTGDGPFLQIANDTAPAVTVGTNPKDVLGMKKPPMTLIPTASLVYLSRVMELGAKKYTPFNWRNPATPVKLTVYLSAAWRHLLQILDGEDNDSESNQPHAAHAMACFAIILDAHACGTLVDDRPIKGAATKVINELTTK
jgi:hypothetical protein